MHAPRKARARQARARLPRAIIPIPNADKGFHEAWEAGRDPLNIPHPFRAVFLGPPGVGKSTLVKNLLLRAEPPFEKLLVVHVDPEGTHEYDDVNGEMLQEIPEPQEFDGEQKTLVVLDDLELKTMSKDQRRCLDRLYGYVSTHKNCSTILAAQDPFSVPTGVRRCSSLLVLWPTGDLDAMATMARKCGRTAQDFRELFELCRKRGPKSAVWMDLSQDSPMPVRIDGYTPVRMLGEP